MISVNRAAPSNLPEKLLAINPEFVTDWLTKFLQDEIVRQRKMQRVVVGLSGGIDSAVATYLAVRALGEENVLTFRMPYKISSPDSLAHAQLIVDHLGLQDRVIDITDMVDGYASQFEAGLSPTRLGNICSRSRMTILFDQAAEVGGLPLGTGNKSERLFGYFTWHGDDAPPINPLGDLFKTQIYPLAEYLGVPKEILQKPASADLVKGQTDEGDFGISYAVADQILCLLVRGFTKDMVVREGFAQRDVDLCFKKVAASHWKRHLPTVAMLTDSAINEYFLRPVDYVD